MDDIKIEPEYILHIPETEDAECLLALKILNDNKINFEIKKEIKPSRFHFQDHPIMLEKIWKNTVLEYWDGLPEIGNFCAQNKLAS